MAIYVALAAIWEPINVGEDEAGNDLPIHTFDFASRWWLFFAMLVFTPIMTYLIFRYRVRAAGGPIIFDWWKWSSIYAMLGLTERHHRRADQQRAERRPRSSLSRRQR